MPEFAVYEEADVHEAECNIKDRYIISHKDAVVIRQITYINNTLSNYPVELPSYPLEYFFICEDFDIKVENDDVPFNIKDSDFSKSITIENSYTLAPHTTLNIVVKCVWKNFINSLDRCRFIIKYPDKAKYKLVIEDYSLKDKKYLIQINNKIATRNDDFYVDNNAIRFKEAVIAHNRPFRAQLLVLSTPDRLKTLSYFLQGNIDNKKFSEYIIFIIQHLLSDFVHIAEAFTTCGADINHIFIIGIPYSTKDKTVDYLKNIGYTNIQTPTNYPFDDVVRNELHKAIQLSEENGKKILIIEDGGYAVPIIHKEFHDKADLFVGAVEQTANGIKRDKKINTEDKIEYIVPIINVADSKIKAALESPLIGRAVCNNLVNLLGKEFTDISGKFVGLVGIGRTGSQIAYTLKAMGAIVKVFSDDKTDMMRAHTEGYTLAEKK
ncbi:MAG: hypothetical protein HY753_01300 [Nitrospirae bacterium]|nr:hypothetical protein [Nitrospirota bacterium]